VRHLPLLVLLACSSRAPGPAPAVAPPASAQAPAPRPDPVEAGVAAGRIALHDSETIARFGANFDPRVLDDVEGFIVELEQREGWSGVVGRVPLAGCCLEPVDIEAPERVGQDWRIRAREGWSFHECKGRPTELLLRLRPDGRYEAECGSETLVLTPGVPLGAHVEKWQRERADALLAAASDSRLSGRAGHWTFESRPVGACAVLALGCDPQRLVASCALDATRVLRVQADRVSVAAGDSPFAGAEQCVDGPLPGLRDGPP
jgi:hypothetical protein